MTTARLRLLVASAGRRVALVECFRRAAQALDIELDVLACDLKPDLSSACQLADEAFAVPRCDDAGYAQALLDIAQRNDVRLIVPTIDPELLPLAEHVDAFAATGTQVHVSPADVIRVARDKQRTAEVLSAAGLPVPVTASYEDVRRSPRNWSWPMFMKPLGGSASRRLCVVNSADELPDRVEEPMILQELLKGPEYTVNMFIDEHGKLRAVVPHLRIQVRAGEVEKGRTERHPDMMALAEGVARALPAARGALCFQAMVDEQRGPRIIEINARFGGGYPLADHAGAPFAKWLLEETLGRPASAHNDWREDVLMLRYDAAVFQG